MKFQVKVTEQVITTLVVEANSEVEALSLARNHRLESIDDMEWVEESIIVKAAYEPVAILKRPFLEMEPC
jgi:hypothetical protein